MKLLTVAAAVLALSLAACTTTQLARAEAAYSAQPYAVRAGWRDAWNASHPEVQIAPRPCAGDPTVAAGAQS